MKYCQNCGRTLLAGDICECDIKNRSTRKTIISKLLNFLGLDIPENNNIYERNMYIVPECITENEGEIPIKQYNIAVLRSRFKFMRAEGRVQITNNRLLFRATGRSLTGDTILQKEFAINAISGIEARIDSRFNISEMLFGILINVFLVFITGIFRIIPVYNFNMFIIFGLMIAITGQIYSFIIKGRLYKFLCSSAGATIAGSLYDFFSGNQINNENQIGANIIHIVFFIVVYITAIISAILYLINFIKFCITPNLLISVNTNQGNGAIQIRREEMGIFSNFSDAIFTGYQEVLPAGDTEKAICELNAIMNDVKNLGDLGVNKWQESEKQKKFSYMNK